MVDEVNSESPDHVMNEENVDKIVENGTDANENDIDRTSDSVLVIKGKQIMEITGVNDEKCVLEDMCEEH